jgi:hypothetical protein
MLAMQMCPTIIETNRIISIIRQSRTIKVEKGQELVNREKLSPKKHRQIEMCEIKDFFSQLKSNIPRFEMYFAIWPGRTNVLFLSFENNNLILKWPVVFFQIV